ncbi:MAG: DUF2165 domain-containing protein [Methylacidiphilaceae bacterium]|nr:DUF2165 domain-containing protein [Candidatus Methylacidiphilaceae bacterium]
MSSLLLVLRTSKTILPFLIGFYFLLAAIDNIADPSANWTYLVHVLSMDTVPGNSPLSGRAIRSPIARRFLFGGLVTWELGTALLCLVGSAKLVRAWPGTHRQFAQAKAWAIAGLASALVQWLFFFLIAAGEWFQLWRGSLSSALDVAARMFAVTALCLIYLVQDEGNPDSSPPD